MAKGIVAIAALWALTLSGCAGDVLKHERTVFNNPYAPPVIARTGIGPQCEVDFGRDATCLGTPLIYPGRGRTVSLGGGETERLTRNQARILRERAALIGARREQAELPPPPPPPPPKAADVQNVETP